MTRSQLFAVPLILASALLIGACRSDKPATNESTPAGSDSATGMAGMPGMPAMASGAMMDSMHVQMKSMAAMSADQMAAMLPDHRSKVANLLSQMSVEMRGMNMPAGAVWGALADSIRQDLIRLPEMTRPELAQAMPPHHARVARLITMHRDMMGKMGKS